MYGYLRNEVAIDKLSLRNLRNLQVIECLVLK